MQVLSVITFTVFGLYMAGSYRPIELSGTKRILAVEKVIETTVALLVQSQRQVLFPALERN